MTETIHCVQCSYDCIKKEASTNFEDCCLCDDHLDSLNKGFVRFFKANDVPIEYRIDNNKRFFINHNNKEIWVRSNSQAIFILADKKNKCFSK